MIGVIKGSRRGGEQANRRAKSEESFGKVPGKCEESLRKVSGKSEDSLRKVSGKSEESLGKVSGKSRGSFKKVAFFGNMKEDYTSDARSRIQWLSVILGSLLFLDACRWVVTRHVVAGRVGGDTPRSCCRNDNRENALVQAWMPRSGEASQVSRWRNIQRYGP